MAKQDHPHDHDHDSSGRCLPHHESPTFVEYDHHGVRFRYPSSWELSEQSDHDETTISVQSEGTSFWTIVLLKSRPDPEDVLETVCTAMDQDYEEVEVVSQVGSLCGLPSLGRDLDFVCFDLMNSAILRSFQTSDLTVLVIYQGTDHELTSTRPLLEEITASLRCDDENEFVEDEEVLP